MDDENESKVGRKPRVTSDELIDVVYATLTDTTHEPPVIVARDIESRVPIGLRAVQKRLIAIADDKDTPLRSYDTGRVHVYWLDEDSDTENNT